MFFATHAVLKIGEYSWIFTSFSWGIFGHMTCLDQSCEQKYLMDYKLCYLHYQVLTINRVIQTNEVKVCTQVSLNNVPLGLFKVSSQ